MNSAVTAKMQKKHLRMCQLHMLTSVLQQFT